MHDVKGLLAYTILIDGNISQLPFTAFRSFITVVGDYIITMKKIVFKYFQGTSLCVSMLLTAWYISIYI